MSKIIYEESGISRIDFSKIGFQIKEENPGVRTKILYLAAQIMGVHLPLWRQNALMDEGEDNVLETYFRNNEAPTEFWVGLGNNGGTPGIPAETTALSGITEVSGTNYARVLVARNTTDWTDPVLDSGDFLTEAKKVTFENTENTGGSNWTAADYAFLATTSDNTGLLISALALSQSYVLGPKEGLNYTFKQKGK